MANVRYENFILENKVKDQLATQLDVNSLMTIDSSLSQNAGMTKVVNTYAYTGSVETVEEGQGNTDFGSAAYTKKEHKVKTTQGRFRYSDEDAMTDPFLIDVLLNGQATEMANDLISKFFAELDKAEVKLQLTGKINYDAVVDAIALMNLENEEGLNLVIGTDLKADIRKDPEFKSKQLGQILASGAIGTICGLPVVVSKAVPAGAAYVVHPTAVTCFVKKGVEVAQVRQENERLNEVYIRKVGLVALTDNTRLVSILPKVAIK